MVVDLSRQRVTKETMEKLFDLAEVSGPNLQNILSFYDFLFSPHKEAQLKEKISSMFKGEHVSLF